MQESRKPPPDSPSVDVVGMVSLAEAHYFYHLGNLPLSPEEIRKLYELDYPGSG